ncbi:MAG TPA: RNase H family protein [Pirellulaceae bacterium]|nr:RNase H family protein [Pirellulaceae bacterium]
MRAPHFLLVSQAAVQGSGQVYSGRWKFELRTPDGLACLAAEDEEAESSAERLELLAIVRGLESLDEPARVTLVSAGRSVSRSLRYGLSQWRENDWQWERYGQLTPVKNGDLWQRIDRAMTIHQVECREATAAPDDLAALNNVAAPLDARPEAAEVRIIHHRGRRLRIDRGKAARMKAEGGRMKATEVHGNSISLVGWLGRLSLFWISALVRRLPGLSGQTP